MINNRVSKWLILCLVSAFMLSACTGNGGNTGGDTGAKATKESGGAGATGKASEGDPYAALPRAVSISMFDRGQVSSDEGTYEENRWVDWIREQSGIDVSIVPVPRNQAQDTLNIMFASKQAPDLVWDFDRNYIGRLVSQGVIQPIGDYIEQYSTAYKAYLEQNPDLLPYLTFDGEIYAMAAKRPVSAIANHGIWIRQDWLEELNLEMPETKEELIEVAEAFKASYPGVTPIVGYTMPDVYAAMHGAINYLWYLDDAGQMRYGATTDRFAAAIELERELYDRGLVDLEYLTDSNNQRAHQLWATGKAGIFISQWGSGTVDSLNRDLLTNVPEADPVAMYAVASEFGRYGYFQESPPHFYIAFNKAMKNPKAAVEYMDWLIEDGWFTLMHGLENEHYKLVDGVPQVIDPNLRTKEVAYAAEYAVLRNDTFQPEHLLIQAAQDELSQDIARRSADSLEKAMAYEFRRDIPYQPNFDEINEIRASLDTFIDEVRARTVMNSSGSSGQQALAEIRAEWERLGGAEAERIAQEWYEANKDQF